MSIEAPIIEAWTTRSHIKPSQIALAHLAVRQNQELVGTNKFSDIYDTQEDLANLEQNYVSGGGNFFTARTEDGQLMGLVGLRNDGDSHATLKRLAVLPEFEGQGAGKALVRELIAWARQNGFTKISLQTGGSEEAKAKIYEKAGFVVTGTVPKEHKADEWLMELSLNLNIYLYRKVLDLYAQP
jgi:ribosomal protein S18 acetylase RimI-like enzyme